MVRRFSASSRYQPTRHMLLSGMIQSHRCADRFNNPGNSGIISVSLLASAHEASLRAQDHAIAEDLQMVCLQRRSCGSDVDDDIRLASCRCSFGRTEAFNDPVELDTVAFREILL